MKALLLDPAQDFNLQEPLPAHAEALTKDLSLEPILGAMAGGDDRVMQVSRRALLCGLSNDPATIAHRQQILRDALAHPAAIRECYALAEEALEARRKLSFSIWAHYPSAVLRGSIESMTMFVGMLERLRRLIERTARDFRSPGLRGLCDMLATELGDDYLAQVQALLAELRFDHGVPLQAVLADSLAPTNYVLCRPTDERGAWWRRWTDEGRRQFTYRLHDRDEAGARIVSETEDRGINNAANALAQATEHVQHFFEMLCVELAFYIGCINLKERLARTSASVCFPEPAPIGSQRLDFTALRDASLALTMNRPIASNTIAADNKRLVVVTGANQGGKSSFLRSLGLALLMMQAGLFVVAERFSGDVCSGLFTHYRREEDAAMTSGKFDEELARMSAIADKVRPGALLLFNESFASTNEREGSQVAGGIVRALLERRMRVAYVTHMVTLATALGAQLPDVLYLRAERRADGSRPFSLVLGEPLRTAYGADLYRTVFPEGVPQGETQEIP